MTRDIKKCPVFNSKLTLDTLPEPQQRYTMGGRKHLADNPALKSLKGVKFFIEPPKGGYQAKGEGRGGRGSGGG